MERLAVDPGRLGVGWGLEDGVREAAGVWAEASGRLGELGLLVAGAETAIGGFVSAWRAGFTAFVDTATELERALTSARHLYLVTERAVAESSSWMTKPSS